MLVSSLFSNINDSYRAQDDDVPTVGTADYLYWLRVTNRKINEWAKDTKNVWESLWSEKTQSGTPLVDMLIVANTQDYTIPTGLIALSDSITVTDTDSNEHSFTVIKAKERERLSGVYVVGTTLTFTDDINTGDTIIGGKITVPGYWLPTDLTGDASVVPVDDPYWLVYAVAKDLASNDLTYAFKAPDLNAQANNLYTAMVTANRRGTNCNPRIVPTKVTRIGMR